MFSYKMVVSAVEMCSLMLVDTLFQQIRQLSQELETASADEHSEQAAAGQ